MKDCPCGSGKNYADCCQPYIENKKSPETAEILMRARYSAYVTCDVDYIESTHTIEAREDVSVDETRKWAEESKWLGLDIIATSKGLESDEEGKVEFTAKYSQNGTVYQHHELSRFHKVDGKWYYLDGRISNQAAPESSKGNVGRNDPCPCGSGKKFKKCCG